MKSSRIWAEYYLILIQIPFFCQAKVYLLVYLSPFNMINQVEIKFCESIVVLVFNTISPCRFKSRVIIGRCSETTDWQLLRTWHQKSQQHRKTILITPRILWFKIYPEANQKIVNYFNVWPSCTYKPLYWVLCINLYTIKPSTSNHYLNLHSITKLSGMQASLLQHLCINLQSADGIKLSLENDKQARIFFHPACDYAFPEDNL